LQIHLHDITIPVAEIVSEIIDELNAEYRSFLSGTSYDELASPSACLSVLRINGDYIEFFSLGDCVSIILTKDNKTEIFLDDSVVKLDGAVIENVISISRDKNITFSDALIYGRHQLIQNRKKLNKPDGYWILNLSGDGIKHAYTDSFPIGGIRCAAIMSDGFDEIVSLFRLYDYKTLMEKMENGDLDSLCDELFKLQDKDPAMDNYPRLSFRDDASAAWGKIAST